jgi:hypothetical protein
MKAFEFQTQVNQNGTLPVPPEVADQLPHEQPVRVILLVPDADEAADWARLTAEEFLKGYADSDAVYDDLSGG